MTTDVFTPAELAYLHSQRLGRLASVDRDGDRRTTPSASSSMTTPVTC
jgi:hypothetical protein